jgi:putative aldouronate transport system permease protein
VLLLIALPGLVYFLLFYYVPLLGYIIAFQNYQPCLGFFNSPFVGFNNFVNMPAMPSSGRLFATR